MKNEDHELNPLYAWVKYAAKRRTDIAIARDLEIHPAAYSRMKSAKSIRFSILARLIRDYNLDANELKTKLLEVDRYFRSKKKKMKSI